MLTLHHAPGSRSARILWLLEEMGLEYQLNQMEFHPKDLKKPEHKERHPLGRVPVLDDGDVRLFESGAIAQYLMARHGDGSLAPNKEDPRYPEFLQWFHYTEGTMMPPINTIVTQTVLLPPDRRNKEVLEMAQRLAGKVLVPVDAAVADREYLIGDFSGADIMLGHAMVASESLKLVNDNLPNLQAYIERIKSRPAFQKAINT
ncbi:MAG: glutathione S-transferase family protein [Sneathiellales bacterium]|nr:glutathione S-transferase family protein [Sneathiellales bacterium]